MNPSEREREKMGKAGRFTWAALGKEGKEEKFEGREREGKKGGKGITAMPPPLHILCVHSQRRSMDPVAFGNCSSAFVAGCSGYTQPHGPKTLRT